MLLLIAGTPFSTTAGTIRAHNDRPPLLKFKPSLAFMDKTGHSQKTSVLVSSTFVPPLKQHLNELKSIFSKNVLDVIDGVPVSTTISYEALNWPSNAPYQISAVGCSCKRYHNDPEIVRKENERREQAEKEWRRRKAEEEEEEEEEARRSPPAADDDREEEPALPLRDTNHVFSEPPGALWEGSENIIKLTIYKTNDVPEFGVTWFALDHEDVYYDKANYKTEHDECGCVVAVIHDIARTNVNKHIRLGLDNVNHTTFVKARDLFPSENWHKHSTDEFVDITFIGSPVEFSSDVEAKLSFYDASTLESDPDFSGYDCRGHKEDVLDSEWMVVWGVINNIWGEDGFVVDDTERRRKVPRVKREHETVDPSLLFGKDTAEIQDYSQFSPIYDTQDTWTVGYISRTSGGVSPQQQRQLKHASLFRNSIACVRIKIRDAVFGRMGAGSTVWSYSRIVMKVWTGWKNGGETMPYLVPVYNDAPRETTPKRRLDFLPRTNIAITGKACSGSTNTTVFMKHAYIFLGVLSAVFFFVFGLLLRMYCR